MAPFRAHWWLRSPHLQTTWATFTRRVPHGGLRRERVDLPDGDFLDLDWTPAHPATAAAPVVLIL
ncbi:MAG: hydrolase, partial [Gammaproteobacteria bacterium]